jgi:hypothetical protein
VTYYGIRPGRLGSEGPAPVRGTGLASSAVPPGDFSFPGLHPGGTAPNGKDQEMFKKRIAEAVAEPASRIMALCLTAIVLALTALLVAASRGR